MIIEPRNTKLRCVFNGYVDNGEDGVHGLCGDLDIRPAYQREFIYDQKDRDAVVRTALNGYPLNSMYWAARGDGKYEVMDGQQRTISLCRYLAGDFSVQLSKDSEAKYFHSLTKDQQERLLDYELMIYICRGEESEKLEWFKTINIAGKELTQQEIRNAVYAGTWLADAKKWFSRRGCPAYRMAQNFIRGKVERQEFLETAIIWDCGSDRTKDIEEYMSRHQLDPNANQLRMKFEAIVNWIQATFLCTPSRKQVLQGPDTDWGRLYDQFHDKIFDTHKIESEIQTLILDDDVSNAGIIPYILTRDEHYLNLRSFTPAMKLAAYERQHHLCANPDCPHNGKEFAFSEMEGDHITPWCEGGKTVKENCQMLCRDCNRRKSAK